jgi:hypothetical protein
MAPDLAAALPRKGQLAGPPRYAGMCSELSVAERAAALAEKACDMEGPTVGAADATAFPRAYTRAGS